MAEAKRPPRGALTVRFEGPGVHDQRMSLEGLAGFAQGLQAAVYRVGDVLAGAAAGPQSGKRRAAAKASCRLSILELRPDSMTLVRDLPATDEATPSVDLGEEALAAFVRGMTGLAGGGGELPSGYDGAVLRALSEGGTLLDRGIEKIIFGFRSGERSAEAVYDAQVHRAVVSAMQELARTSASAETRAPAGDAREHKFRRRIVSATDAKRRYVVDGETVWALRGITLDVYEGEYLSIMGPSGSGKTTLFNLIGGLDRPTEGTVTVQGVAISRLTRLQQARFRNRYIGYIFQTYNLIPVMTALQNVALPMLLGGMDVAAASEKAASILADVGLGHRLHHRPDELSGGQQQRVAIARAFANDPLIILADEPTGNLDTATGEEIIERLSRYSRERGVTIITATHDHKMLSVSDRVITVRDGRVDTIDLRSQMDIQVGSIEMSGGGDGHG